MITYFLDHGANVNAHNRAGVTPLLLAVIGDDPDLVRLLLDRQANVNAMTHYDGTPLACAVLASGGDVPERTRRREIIMLLKHHGGRVMFGASVKNLPPWLVKKYMDSLLEPGEQQPATPLTSIVRTQFEAIARRSPAFVRVQIPLATAALTFGKQQGTHMLND